MKGTINFLLFLTALHRRYYDTFSHEWIRVLPLTDRQETLWIKRVRVSRAKSHTWFVSSDLSLVISTEDFLFIICCVFMRAFSHKKPEWQFLDSTELIRRARNKDRVLFHFCLKNLSNDYARQLAWQISTFSFLSCSSFMKKTCEAKGRNKENKNIGIVGVKRNHNRMFVCSFLQVERKGCSHSLYGDISFWGRKILRHTDCWIQFSTRVWKEKVTPVFLRESLTPWLFLNQFPSLLGS
jgi:hypothetical protein